MPTEPDYRCLLEKAQQCTDEVKEFLVAICNSPQGKRNDAILGAAAMTVEQLRIVESQVDGIWELFQRGRSATHEATASEYAPPTQPDDDAGDKPMPPSWPD